MTSSTGYLDRLQCRRKERARDMVNIGALDFSSIDIRSMIAALSEVRPRHGPPPTRVSSIAVQPFRPVRGARGELLAVPIKIVLETREGDTVEEAKKLIEHYGRAFRAEAESAGIKIALEETVQAIAEGRRYILPFQAICSNWQSALTSFIRQFFEAIRKGRDIPVDVTPVISTHSSVLYPLRLVTVHDKLPLAHIRFGSLMSAGRLGIHWSMTGGPLLSDDKEKGFTFPKEIYSSFEYDKRFIMIQYFNREPDTSSDSPDEVDVEGRIQIEMSLINRILLDQCDKNNQERIALVLLLDAPPKFLVRRVTKDRRGNPKTSCWEYKTELQRGAYPGEKSDKVTLHDAKAVVLEFDLEAVKAKLSAASPIPAFLYDLLSRLRHRTGKSIEFCSLEHQLLLKGEVRAARYGGDRSLVKVCPFGDAPAFDAKVSKFINDAAGKVVANVILDDGQSRLYHARWKAFRLQALLQGILDRGMDIRLQLLLNRKIWYYFVETVADHYVKDEERTLATLERLMEIISEGRLNSSIPRQFEKEWATTDRGEVLAAFRDYEKREGLWRIMKLVATPTRLIFIGNELIMGNRVLNQHANNENHIIRLTFRDDRGRPMRKSEYQKKVQARFKGFLVDGITYAGRTFAWLGNSNSQMREQGVYMMHVDFGDRSQKTPHEIRCDLGEFHEQKTIPKLIARLGLAFTSSKRSKTWIARSEVGTEHDLIGGGDEDGKPYTFSDGVGLVSARYAAELSHEHGLRAPASAFQIRFRGEKGLLCADPIMDERNALLRKLRIVGEERKVLVRPSMSKFQVMARDRLNLEIVKCSNSTPVFLNRPLINILCQVSEKQSVACHSRVRGRVEELMDAMMREILQSLYVENKAYQIVNELAFPFCMEILNESSALDLTTEPFFRSLLQANAKYAIQKQLHKANIRIPATSGRSMFGVVDRTGLLQYGQVFCQYSSSVSKQGSRHARVPIILTGATMLTKNPCISSGDVRMFDAVDIPALRHLVDVVVFPMHGPRPHPDEMAGSDLDGDEYMVIWDERLLFERNEQAATFPAAEENPHWRIPRYGDGTVNLEKCEDMKAAFYTEAIVEGQPGFICAAHLGASDLYGLDSKPSESLAWKVAQSLDYYKSGVRPATMTTFNPEDKKDPSRVIPAERCPLKPDFMRKYQEPAYESRGILGSAFREASTYEHALDCVEEEREKIEPDPAFAIPGWERYKNEAEKEFANYSHAMKSVFEHYGIATERELMSGMIISVKTKLSEKEDEDGTFFTTNRIIEGKVKRIIETAREKFFEEFRDWRLDLEEVEHKRNDVGADSILHMRVGAHNPNIGEIRRKAAAAYNVAYEAAAAAAARGEDCCILLSFPWIMYDVLLDIKKRPDQGRTGGGKEWKGEPLAQILSDTIDSHCEQSSNAKKFAEFKRRFGSEEDSVVAQLLRENEGLARAAFVAVEWARHVGGLSGRFGEEHLLSLFIQFGLREMGSVEVRGQKRKGDHLLLFIDYASSWQFRTQPHLSLAEVGGGVLMRGEWRAFAEAALASLISLATTHRLDLPMEGRSAVATTVLRELEPRMMLLPESAVDDEMGEIRDSLRAKSGCKAVELRKIAYNKVMVSAIGSSEQLRLLTKLILPPAPSRESATLKGMINSMERFTYERLASKGLYYEDFTEDYEDDLEYDDDLDYQDDPEDVGDDLEDVNDVE